MTAPLFELPTARPPQGDPAFPIDRVQLRAAHPRRHYDLAAQAQLVTSVQAWGVRIPILLCRSGEIYFVVAGARRLAAASLAGLTTIPTHIYHDLDESQMQRLALTSELHSHRLSPVDEALAVVDLYADELQIPSDAVRPELERLRRLCRRDPGLITASDADRQMIHRVRVLFQSVIGGNWQSFVVNRLPLVSLPIPLQSAIRSGLPYTKAKVLSKVASDELPAWIVRARDLSLAELTLARAAGSVQAGAPLTPAAPAADGQLCSVSHLQLVALRGRNPEACLRAQKLITELNALIATP
jgi:ParB family transcriptional regulator, chromosome partitioning protein